MKIHNDQGWTEAIIDEKSDTDFFYKTANILKSVFTITFTNKLTDLDSIYWDFTYKGAELVLHFNTFVGTVIFPKALKNSTNLDNQIVAELSKSFNEDLVKFNTPSNFVSKYFGEPPSQWGLRGDPHLWEDLKKATETKKVPTTTNELEKILHKLFKELTGKDAKKGENIFVERYNLGGMSSGMVCSDFWLDKGFAIIIQRFIESELR